MAYFRQHDEKKDCYTADIGRAHGTDRCWHGGGLLRASPRSGMAGLLCGVLWRRAGGQPWPDDGFCRKKYQEVTGGGMSSAGPKGRWMNV